MGYPPLFHWLAPSTPLIIPAMASERGTYGPAEPGLWVTFFEMAGTVQRRNNEFRLGWNYRRSQARVQASYLLCVTPQGGDSSLSSRDLFLAQRSGAACAADDGDVYTCER